VTRAQRDQCGRNPGNQQNRSTIQEYPSNSARSLDRNQKIEYDGQDGAQAENLKRSSTALDEDTCAGSVQDWGAWFDANGHEEGDAEKVRRIADSFAFIWASAVSDIVSVPRYKSWLFGKSRASL